MRDSRGATMIEYGLILAFIFVVMMVAVHALSEKVIGTWNSVANQVSNAGSA